MVLFTNQSIEKYYFKSFQLLEYQWRWREGKFDKLTPSSLPPYSMFMTEVTSMDGSSVVRRQK